MTRDLRDMCVSSYFHSKSDPSHKDFELYKRLSIEEGLAHRIENYTEYYGRWIGDWMAVQHQNPDKIILIRYEDLILEPVATFTRLLDFYKIQVADKAMRTFIESRVNSERELPKELAASVVLRQRSTARKGRIGEWSKYFTQQHVELFDRKVASLKIST